MARIGTKVLKITPPESPSTDQVGFFLRIVPDGEPLTLETPPIFLELKAAEEDGKIHYDLSLLPEVQSFDGLYDVGVTAVDDNQPVRNESDFLNLDDVTFDFTAPTAPAAIEIE